MLACTLILLAAFLSGAMQAEATPPPATADDSAAMAARIRQEFLHAWRGYHEYAWGHDELRPLSKGFHDWHAAPLYMTPVDALDTMLLMGLNEEADQTRNLIAKNLSFDRDIEVQNFEITIRLLGGLLSSSAIACFRSSIRPPACLTDSSI